MCIRDRAGAIASGTLSYTTSPVHTQKKYVEMVKELKEMGASTICIKDMAGIMGPKEVSVRTRSIHIG